VSITIEGPEMKFIDLDQVLVVFRCIILWTYHFSWLF